MRIKRVTVVGITIHTVYTPDGGGGEKTPMVITQQ